MPLKWLRFENEGRGAVKNSFDGDLIHQRLEQSSNADEKVIPLCAGKETYKHTHTDAANVSQSTGVILPFTSAVCFLSSV